jgi:integration host factor subunit beta
LSGQGTLISDVENKPLYIAETAQDITERKTAEKLGLKIFQVEEAVDGMFTVLREMMSGDESNIRIEVRNIGAFEIKPTKAKPRARNPYTNEEIFVPARRKTHFKPGKLIRKVLKQPLK